MITTVTLNPAIDKTITTSRLLPGQVNRSESVKNIAGGKGINVTKVLRQYGNSVCALGFLGGYTGRFIEEYVKGLGAESAFTEIAGKTRTSTNVLSQDGYVTEILEPGPVITEEEKEQFLQTYRKKIAGSEFVVLSGSAPKGLPTDIYAQLVALADKQQIRSVLDTSGELLVRGVKAKPFLIKPNCKELEYLTGRRLRELSEIKEAALQLVSEGIAHVLVSMGEKGILYAAEGRCLFAKGQSTEYGRLRGQCGSGCGHGLAAGRFRGGYFKVVRGNIGSEYHDTGKCGDSEGICCRASYTDHGYRVIGILNNRQSIKQ